MGGSKELVQYLVEDLKCDVGEFVGACLHMTACDNRFVYRQTKLTSHHKVVVSGG